MFCEKCGTLIAPRRPCPYCSRLGKDELEPLVSTLLTREFKVCSRCGGKMKLDTQYKLCYECRRNNAPQARAETEYDEAHPPSE
jgi:uncharacterized metal-binding protein YceD (DUF177 family)